MRRRSIVLLPVVITIAACLASCQWLANLNGSPLEADVRSLLDARERGVNQTDAKAYLSTVLPSDAVLQKEESNLIRAAGSLGIGDYNIEAGSIRKTDGGCTATLRQEYTIGAVKHSCEYTAAFMREGETLYYAGPAFTVDRNDKVAVYYLLTRKDLAQALLDTETNILNEMNAQLGFAPKGVISVKIFEDQAVFLQSIKLDLPEWVGGWHEYGESVKTFVGAYGTDVENYRGMLAHESTHRMVSELSNDNAAYWLQEGLAGVYQELLLDPEAEALTADEAGQTFTPFAEQKTADLEKLDASDGDAVMCYYASSKAYAAFLLEQFGWEKMRRMLEYMQKYELIPVTAAEKLDEANARTDEAIASVYGYQGSEAFQKAFDEWLAA